MDDRDRPVAATGPDTSADRRAPAVPADATAPAIPTDQPSPADPWRTPDRSAAGSRPWTPDGPAAHPTGPTAAVATTTDATAAKPDPVTEPFAAVRPGPADTTSGHAPDRADLGTWTFTDAMVGLGVVLLATSVLSAGVQILLANGVSRGPWLPLLGLLPVWIGLLGTTVWACRRHGTGNLVSDLGLRITWADLGVGIGIAIVARIGATLLAVLVTGITRERGESNLQDFVTPGLGHTGWLIVYAIAISILGPIVEEIFFRGLALRSALASLSRSTRPRFATPAARQRFAALGTAALFAALHLQEVGSLTSLLVLMPALFFFGWMAARWTMHTGRLGGAIVAHIGFNAVAAAVLLSGGLGQ